MLSTTQKHSLDLAVIVCYTICTIGSGIADCERTRGTGKVRAFGAFCDTSVTKNLLHERTD